MISLSGLVIPMVMGIGLGTVLDGLEPTLFPGDRRLDGALFMGTAMAITALPRRRSRVCELGASRGCGCVHSLWFNLGVRDSPWSSPFVEHFWGPGAAPALVGFPLATLWLWVG